MNNTQLIAVIVMSILLLSACAQVSNTPPINPEVKANETASPMNEVGITIGDVGSLDKDLDISELDDIERDLEDISNGW